MEKNKPTSTEVGEIIEQIIHRVREDDGEALKAGKMTIEEEATQSIESLILSFCIEILNRLEGQSRSLAIMPHPMDKKSLPMPVEAVNTSSIETIRLILEAQLTASKEAQDE